MDRSSTSGDGPSGPGRTRVHQRRRSFSDLSLTCTNRRFRLRADHRLQTNEQALRLLLSEIWSMMWSTSSCGNSRMMAVVVEGPSPTHVFTFSHLQAATGNAVTAQCDPHRPPQTHSRTYLLSNAEDPRSTLNDITRLTTIDYTVGLKSATSRCFSVLSRDVYLRL